MTSSVVVFSTESSFLPAFEIMTPYIPERMNWGPPSGISSCELMSFLRNSM